MQRRPMVGSPQAWLEGAAVACLHDLRMPGRTCYGIMFANSAYALMQGAENTCSGAWGLDARTGQPRSREAPAAGVFLTQRDAQPRAFKQQLQLQHLLLLPS